MTRFHTNAIATLGWTSTRERVGYDMYASIRPSFTLAKLQLHVQGSERKNTGTGPPRR